MLAQRCVLLLMVVVTAVCSGCRRDTDQAGRGRRPVRPQVSGFSVDRLKQDFARAFKLPQATIAHIRARDLKHHPSVAGAVAGIYTQAGQSRAGLLLYHRCAGAELCVARHRLGSADELALLRVVDLAAAKTVFIPSAPALGRLREPSTARWPVLLVRLRRLVPLGQHQYLLGVSLRRPERPERLFYLETLSDATKRPPAHVGARGGKRSQGNQAAASGTGLRKYRPCVEYGITRVERITILGRSKPPELVVQRRRQRTDSSRCADFRKTRQRVRYRLEQGYFHSPRGQPQQWY